jgi:hypothetical protein
MISGHFQGTYPDLRTFPPVIYPDYSELIRKARLYDEIMKQPDCQDPAKEKWHAELEKFMADKYGLKPSGAAA